MLRKSVSLFVLFFYCLVITRIKHRIWNNGIIIKITITKIANGIKIVHYAFFIDLNLSLRINVNDILK